MSGEVAESEYEYIALPGEVGGGVGRLRRWLHGRRPAASPWEDHCVAKLKDAGFDRARAAPIAFANHETGVRVVVWGGSPDDSGCGRQPVLASGCCAAPAQER